MASTDLDALVALFRSTGGARWCERDDGDTAAELANWSGVDLNDDGRVVQLFQNENGLKGDFAGDACFSLETDLLDQPQDFMIEESDFAECGVLLNTYTCSRLNTPSWLMLVRYSSFGALGLPACPV